MASAAASSAARGLLATPAVLLAFLLALLALLPPSAATASETAPVDVVIGIDGGTESVRACCFNAHTGSILGKPCASPYATTRPEAGWAEQDPDDWWAGLCGAVRGAVGSLPDREGGEGEGDAGGDGGSVPRGYAVRALCCDTTCCSVVALSIGRAAADEGEGGDGKGSHSPLRPCLLWMDARSAPQASKIMEVARKLTAEAMGKDVDEVTGADVAVQFPELRVNSGGEGPISAEWLLPKSMWIKENQPAIWDEADVICEYQDFVNEKLTGRMCASSCNAAVRWHHDGREVLKGKDAGRPTKLYDALDMEDLAEKLPRETLAMGDVVGGLTKQAAGELGLPEGTAVVQGGPDAFVGMIGLGAVHPRDVCLITGSSHLHCLVTPAATSAPGTWGAYRGAPLPHLNFAEGGQSSTGSLVRWMRDLVSSGDAEVPYEALDEEASRLPPGCDGLVALETWQGSRTPQTDPLARGAFVGLTLSHTRAHLFRAILESVCFGTRSCLEALEAAAAQNEVDGGGDGGRRSDEVVVAGGAARSALWLQLHADITGRSILLNENADGPLLGCAILASVGAGIHASVEEAVDRMVRRERRIEPRPEVTEVYDKLYEEVYLKVRPAVRGVFHALAELRGGARMTGDSKTIQGGTHSTKKEPLIPNSGIKCEKWGTQCLSTRGGSTDGSEQQWRQLKHQTEPTSPIISPSLLASDWSDIKGEVQKCLDAGLPWIHVDVFDGVFIDSPKALTFGPQMVDSIRKRFADCQELILDVHLCVDRPERYAKPMAEAGATRVIFMWEAMLVERGNGHSALSSAVAAARTITSFGTKCGVSINPETPVTDILGLLDTGLVDLVDVLAVEPGFGGQQFNAVAMEKIAKLRKYIDENLSPLGINVKILVDGGINSETSKLVGDTGADILVAGTALFQHQHGFEEAVKELLSKSDHDRQF